MKMLEIGKMLELGWNLLGILWFIMACITFMVKPEHAFAYMVLGIGSMIVSYLAKIDNKLSNR